MFEAHLKDKTLKNVRKSEKRKSKANMLKQALAFHFPGLQKYITSEKIYDKSNQGSQDSESGENYAFVDRKWNTYVQAIEKFVEWHQDQKGDVEYGQETDPLIVLWRFKSSFQKEIDECLKAENKKWLSPTQLDAVIKYRAESARIVDEQEN